MSPSCLEKAIERYDADHGVALYESLDDWVFEMAVAIISFQQTLCIAVRRNDRTGKNIYRLEDCCLVHVTDVQPEAHCSHLFQ